MENKQVKAQGKNIRRSPRKLRLIADAVRGMNADLALASLTYLSKGGAREVWKVVNSATANAVNNFKMKREDLIISHISVDEATMLKRFRTESKGRGRRILRRSSHINVVVQSANPAAAKKSAKAEVKAEEVKVEAKAEASTEKPKLAKIKSKVSAAKTTKVKSK